MNTNNSVKVGDYVSFLKGSEGLVADGWGSQYNPCPDTYYRVTRVYSKRIQVTGRETFTIDKSSIAENAGETHPGTHVPEGSIAPDDERLSYLWERASAIAERRGLCEEYDSICDELGIPGRLRTFTVELKKNNLDLTIKLKARSYKEADFLARLAVEGVK